jgi:hypothetical protein
VHDALALDLPRDDTPIQSELSGLPSHQDGVYAFALTLVGDDAEQAAALTESVFASVRADVASTLTVRRPPTTLRRHSPE